MYNICIVLCTPIHCVNAFFRWILSDASSHSILGCCSNVLVEKIMLAGWSATWLGYGLRILNMGHQWYNSQMPRLWLKWAFSMKTLNTRIKTRWVQNPEYGKFAFCKVWKIRYGENNCSTKGKVWKKCGISVSLNGDKPSLTGPSKHRTSRVDRSRTGICDARAVFRLIVINVIDQWCQELRRIF